MKIQFLEGAFEAIRATVGSKKAESGGILLGSREDYIVQKFVFDPYGSTSPTGYDPDVDFINATIKKEWEENGLALLGFVHSHPRGYNRLSGDYGNNTGDLGYLRAILKAIPALDKFLVPIVFSSYDGEAFEMIPFVAFANNVENYQAWGIEIVQDKVITMQTPDKSELEALCSKEQAWDIEPCTLKEEKASTGLKDASRLSGSVDLELMCRTHVVGVGVGGACGVYENLVRSGLGKLTVIDFDFVDVSNITTQGYNIPEIGLAKVEALKSRLLAINPKVEIYTIQVDFLKLDETQLNQIFSDANLLMMMTDNFDAQAYGNIIALKYQIPAVFAMMYEKARASEIIFTIPGVTPACFRCAVSSRYKAYYEEGFVNDVRSVGSTIFHTQYLNSAIGLLSLAVLHHSTEDLEFSNWFGQRWERNLIQLRHHPSYSSHENGIFSQTFKHISRIFNFDAIWQLIEEEKPPKYNFCPDCKGLGDLRLSAKFYKTFCAKEIGDTDIGPDKGDVPFSIYIG